MILWLVHLPDKAVGRVEPQQRQYYCCPICAAVSLTASYKWMPDPWYHLWRLSGKERQWEVNWAPHFIMSRLNIWWTNTSHHNGSICCWTTFTIISPSITMLILYLKVFQLTLSFDFIILLQHGWWPTLLQTGANWISILWGSPVVIM